MFNRLMGKTLLLCLLGALPITALAHGPSTGGAVSELPPEQTDWGIGASADAVEREITVRMDDAMRFYPDHFTVSEGETVRLVIHNDGKLLHELVLGSQEELDEHARLMEKFPNMAHDEPYMAHVDPGKSASIIWTFNRAGRVDFACLLPGHYQAGMVGFVDVAPASVGHAEHH